MTFASRESSSRLLDRLRRVTTSGRYIPEIDGLRFIAIASVFLLHLATHFGRHAASPAGAHESWLWRGFQTGGAGVLVFFSISGFILALPFVAAEERNGEAVALRRYYLRRLTRLEPPYVSSLLLLAAVAAWRGADAALVPHLAASLGYVHNVVYGTWSSINPVAWSLEIEVQFYLLMPLIAKLFRWPRRVRRLLLLACIPACIVLDELLPLRALHLDKSLLNHFQHFVPGILFADLYATSGAAERRTHDVERRGILWDLLALIALIVIFSCPAAGPASMAIPFSTLLLLFATFRSVTFRALTRNPVIATIGGMCYSIYLLHYPLLALILPVTGRAEVPGGLGVNLLFQALVTAPVVLGVSGLFFAFVERPCMRPNWPQRLLAWWRSGVVRSATSKLD
jgi:peptidoglycan/LPS O-acetylase OafA/YrhL